jgi:hypothetical protein
MRNFYKREVITLLKGGEVNYAKICSNCIYYYFVTGWHGAICKAPKVNRQAHTGETFWLTIYDFASHCEEFQLSDRVRR